MTGIRIDKNRATNLVVGDRVRTLTGRKGRVERLRLGFNGLEVKVVWDDGETFWIISSHLHIDDKPFGMDTSKDPG